MTSFNDVVESHERSDRRTRVERSIIKYLVLMGAIVDSESMIIDVAKCKPLSAALLRAAIEAGE
jgi:hypothetical protein